VSGPLTAIQKGLALAAAVIGQAPWITTVTGMYPISIYQPAIYLDIKPFLLIPLALGVFSTWIAVIYKRSIWCLVGIFLALSAFVYWIFVTFPPLSTIHPINWIFSYVAFALFVAILCRALIDLLELAKGTEPFDENS
jgi:hypothetical protein